MVEIFLIMLTVCKIMCVNNVQNLDQICVACSVLVYCELNNTKTFILQCNWNFISQAVDRTYSM